ncbi:MAG: type I methionyl aminopeptidase [Clostridiales bacterium]|nr:type I methionyl aminopeptidase [Clostridiales bacterium]
MIKLKTEAQIEKMRAAGVLLHSVLTALRAAARPGVTTLELDRMAEDMIRSAGATPSFKGYAGFPYSICASIDDQVVHGFSNDRPLLQGQLLSIDCGCKLDGWQSDSALSVVVGGGNAEAQRLIDITERCFWLGADMAREGNRLGDIGHAVQTYAESMGCGVVRDYTGHGIGREMHEDPSVPNYGYAGRGLKLQKGMTIAIEPMITLGTWRTKKLSDGWTAVTADGSLAAHYEHTVLVTDGEPELLSFPGARISEALR